MGFDVLSYAMGLRAGKNAGGGSSGGSSESESSYVYSKFGATANKMTLKHGGSKVPDLIIVALQEIPNNGYLFFAFAFSQRMIDKLGGGYINKIAVVREDGSTITMTSDAGSENAGAMYYEMYGGIRNVTDTEFTIGTTDVIGKLLTGESYQLMAFFDLA